jgi:hypothetical protein
MDKKVYQANELMRQNGAIQTSKTNSWTLRGIKYFFNKHGIFFFSKISQPNTPARKHDSDFTRRNISLQLSF